MEELVLTESQQQVHDQLLSFATEKPARFPFAVFKGYAGVGKSTVIGKLINKLITMMPSGFIGVSAPTHKAVKVLRRDAVQGVGYKTIHSWLKLKEKYDDATGEISYVPDTFDKNLPPISGLRIMVMDETSMLNTEIFNHMVPWMKKGLRVIFAGDPAQIPPVKQRDCIPFMHGKDWGALVVELTEVRRQKAGNPILEFATEVRVNHKNLNYQFTPKTQLNERGEGIQLTEYHSAEEKDTLRKYFTDPFFAENPDFMKVIAWTNKTVDAYNQTIRELIYPDMEVLPAIMTGEKLILDRPYTIGARNVIPNNEEIEVIHVMTSTQSVSYKDHWGVQGDEQFNTYFIDLKYFIDGEEKRASMPLIHESSLTDFNKLIAKLTDYALEAPQVMRGRMWRQKYKTIEQFGWTKYNYAITAHKSQGSTYDNALVLKWDIDKNYDNIEERNRILYVACTRSRHKLYIEQ